VRAAQQVAQRGAGDERLEATAVATAADRALRIDQNVADLPRDAARATERAPVEDEARADAGREAQVGHHVGPAAGPERRLAEGADVGVVVEVDRQPEPRLHLGGGVEADPAGQDRLRVHEPALAVDRARQAHAGGEHAAARDAGLLNQLGDQPGGGVERVLRGGVDLELGVALGQDRVREVRDGDPERVVAEVQADDRPRRAVERHEHRRAAALRAGRGHAVGHALDDHAGRLQVADEARHRGSAQPGLPRDLCAADRPSRPQRVDDAQSITFAQGLQRPGAELTHGRDPL
jgi:hypothetical protein